MPAKIKQRSQTGLTNKSSSKSNLASVQQHSKKCVCQTCTCGKHVCQQKGKATSTGPTPNTLLEGVSETKQQYHEHQIPERKLMKQVHNLPPKHDISNETESASQYVPKDVPPRPQPHIEKYVKNPNQLEGQSETKTQFITREIPVRKDFKPRHDMPPTRNIENATESSSQYVSKPVPPRPQPHLQKYVKNENQLEGKSETKTQFIEREIPDRKNFKPQHDLPPKRDIETFTETSSTYVPKPVPPRPQPHLQKYEPNPNKLEGVSELKSAYVEWPNQGRPNKYKKAEYKNNGQKLEGSSVTQSDYKGAEQTERAKPLKVASQYTPPTGPLDTHSLYSDEYKGHTNVTPPKKHEREVLQTQREDRDFTSVTKAAYLPVDASHIHPPAKHIQKYVPSTSKLEGESVLHSDYRAYDLSTIERKDLKLAALRDRQGTLKGNDKNINDGTEYKDRYATLSVRDRVQPIRPPINSSLPGAKSPLEGNSESSYAYKSPDQMSPQGKAVYKMADSFKPAHTKKTGGDDRDFKTETGDGFDGTKLEACPVVSKCNCEKSVGQDGHLYFADSVNAA